MKLHLIGHFFCLLRRSFNVGRSSRGHIRQYAPARNTQDISKNRDYTESDTTFTVERIVGKRESDNRLNGGLTFKSPRLTSSGLLAAWHRH